jgi:hypothetical protein
MKMASMVAIAMMALVAVGCGAVAEEGTGMYSTGLTNCDAEFLTSPNCHLTFSRVCAFGGAIYSCCGGTGDGVMEFSFCNDVNGDPQCDALFHSDDGYDYCDTGGGGGEGGGGGGGGCLGLGDECGGSVFCCSQLACDASNHCIIPGT